MEITKEDWNRYRKVQASGETNMFDLKVVENLSNVTKSKIIEIMQNYSKYAEQYGEE